MANASSEKQGGITAIILAASRQGVPDPVAAAQGKSHKCLVELGGMTMLERVVRTVSACTKIGKILVSAESETVLEVSSFLQDLASTGRLVFSKSAETLDASIRAAVSKIDKAFPLLITTGDNALHTPEMIDYFVKATLEKNPDVALGMTDRETVLARYPEGERAFHKFKDGSWSSCNLYWLKSPEALPTAMIFKGGGQFGKKPWRLLRAFGPRFMMNYRLRRKTLEQTRARLAARWRLDIQVVAMPFAEAPIDVDRLKDLALAKRVLADRARALQS